MSQYPGAMARVIERHPLWLRLTHGIVFPWMVILVWSGVLIYWANDVYPGFFPEGFYSALSIDHRLAQGMWLHFTAGWGLVADGAVFLALTLASGHWRELVPDRRSLRELVPTILSELGVGAPRPRAGKYNAAQRFAYSSLVIVVVLEIATGFALYKPVQLGRLAELFGGYERARFIHFVGMLSIVAFFVIHLIQVARAGWNCLRSIVAGFEVEK